MVAVKKKEILNHVGRRPTAADCPSCPAPLSLSLYGQNTFGQKSAPV